MNPKSRIDALTDGIFAVAMTILVLDLRLPDALDVTESSVRHALQISLSFVIATSALCVVLSVFDPADALWVYGLNFAEPRFARWISVKRANRLKHPN